MKPILFALVATIPLLATPVSAAPESQAGIISVTGKGSVSMTPDMAVVSAGVQTQKKQAKEALAENNRKMAALMAELKKAGIESKDIQTSNFNIHPQMVYPKQREAKPPRIVGYNVSNQVAVKIRKLESVGTVLTALVEAGANNMSGLHFDVSDKAEKLAEARKAAIADARAKAKLYADGVDVKIKRLKSLSENGSYAPSPVMMRAPKMEMMADAAPVPVAQGSMSLSININTSWELDN